MSADWAARQPLRPGALTTPRSTSTAAIGEAPAKRMPSSPASATSVISSAVAISVLLGTQSVSTAEPPRPSRVDDGDVGAELGGDQRRLVARRDRHR